MAAPWERIRGTSGHPPQKATLLYHYQLLNLSKCVKNGDEVSRESHLLILESVKKVQ